MPNFILVVFIIIASFKYLKDRNQKKFIATYHFPPTCSTKLSEQHPHLTTEQIQEVFDALREYFYLCRLSKGQMIAMPSKVVDDAWHEFLLYTQEYAHFCKRAFGRFLHHTPTETMSLDSIVLAWWLACKNQGMDPKAPTVLPLLFNIDDLFAIPNEFIHGNDFLPNGYYYDTVNNYLTTPKVRRTKDGGSCSGGDGGGGGGGGCGGCGG